MQQAFGDKLKSVRIQRGLSQEELAALLGTSKQVISRYETNQRVPKITVAQAYAKKLKVPLRALLADSSPQAAEQPVYPEGGRPDPLVERATELLSALSPALREIALEQLDALAKLQEKR